MYARFQGLTTTEVRGSVAHSSFNEGVKYPDLNIRDC